MRFLKIIILFLGNDFQGLVVNSRKAVASAIAAKDINVAAEMEVGTPGGGKKRFVAEAPDGYK